MIFVLLLTVSIQSEENPYIFIDTNAQKMVEVLTADADLFETNRLLMHEEGNEYDIVINTTPISMNVDDIILPPELIINKPICYDLFYDKEKTFFQKWAEKNESTVNYDGLGMLIHQAKHSFKIWNNLSPDIDGLEELLRRN